MSGADSNGICELLIIISILRSVECFGFAKDFMSCLIFALVLIVTRDLLHNFGTIFTVKIHLKILVEEANFLSHVSPRLPAKICYGVYGPTSSPKIQNIEMKQA